MLVQQPELPFLAIPDEYYRLSSTPSTLTQTQVPGALFALPFSTSVVQNHVVLRRLAYPDRFYQLPTPNQSPQPPYHSCSPYVTPATPSTNTMPRPCNTKANQDANSSVFPAPPVPVVTGGKRGASAVSGNAVTQHLNTPGLQPNSDDHPLRLPPKLKEAERMMHVQRWVNHLPGPVTDNSNGLPLHWGFDNSPGYRRIDDDRELTPPPSRTYLSQLPFTPEEEQTMMRFFSHNSEYRHPQHASAVIQNPYSTNPPPFPYHNQGITAVRQTSNDAHFVLPAQHAAQGAGDETGAAKCIPDQKIGGPRKPDPDCTGGNRFFAEWETRLISHLFYEYFPGSPEPMGNTGVLPSVREVRSRIATSRLKDTRTATAVRAKIKRMQSAGTWIERQ